MTQSEQSPTPLQAEPTALGLAAWLEHGEEKRKSASLRLEHLNKTIWDGFEGDGEAISDEGAEALAALVGELCEESRSYRRFREKKQRVAELLRLDDETTRVPTSHEKEDQLDAILDNEAMQGVQAADMDAAAQAEESEDQQENPPSVEGGSAGCQAFEIITESGLNQEAGEQGGDSSDGQIERAEDYPRQDRSDPATNNRDERVSEKIGEPSADGAIAALPRQPISTSGEQQLYREQIDDQSIDTFHSRKQRPEAHVPNVSIPKSQTSIESRLEQIKNIFNATHKKSHMGDVGSGIQQGVSQRSVQDQGSSQNTQFQGGREQRAMQAPPVTQNLIGTGPPGESFQSDDLRQAPRNVVSRLTPTNTGNGFVPQNPSGTQAAGNPDFRQNFQVSTMASSFNPLQHSESTPQSQLPNAIGPGQTTHNTQQPPNMYVNQEQQYMQIGQPPQHLQIPPPIQNTSSTQPQQFMQGIPSQVGVQGLQPQPSMPNLQLQQSAQNGQAQQSMPTMQPQQYMPSFQLQQGGNAERQAFMTLGQNPSVQIVPSGVSRNPPQAQGAGTSLPLALLPTTHLAQTSQNDAQQQILQQMAQLQSEELRFMKAVYANQTNQGGHNFDGQMVNPQQFPSNAQRPQASNQPVYNSGEFGHGTAGNYTQGLGGGYTNGSCTQSFGQPPILQMPQALISHPNAEVNRKRQFQGFQDAYGKRWRY